MVVIGECGFGLGNKACRSSLCSDLSLSCEEMKLKIDSKCLGSTHLDSIHFT